MNLDPQYKSNKFQCPHCRIASQQTWFDADSASKDTKSGIRYIYFDYRTRIQDYEQKAITAFISELSNAIEKNAFSFVPRGFSAATCASCQKSTLWIGRDLVYPKQTSLPPPNSDLSEKTKALYCEASTIFIDSPKGAAALLRLALQILLKELGKSGKNINNDIKELVEAGLSPKIQQALDLLRVVGNNAVHPGQIDLDDGGEVATKMFHVLNFIAEELITKPKELDFLYNGVIPEETRNQIIQRDDKSKA